MSEKGISLLTERHKNMILFVLVLGVMMSAIDSTIVLLALPVMVQQLHSSIATMIWVILIYILVVSVASTQLGKIGDIYGRSRMFNLGFAVFTVASFFCGLAPTDILLIFGRGVQAIGGALMQSNSGAIIADTFDRKRIGRAYGFTSLGWGFGSVLGIVLGGIITTFVGYRYIFYINVPIGIVAVIFGIRYLRDGLLSKRKIDLFGMLMLAASLLLISYSAITISTIGLDYANFIMLLFGVGLLYLFIKIDRKAASPTINFSAFGNRILRNSMLASFFQSLGYIGVVFALIMYLQGVRGISPFNAALLLVPGYIISSSLGPFMGRFSDRYGAKKIATAGICLMAAGVVVYLTMTATSYIYIVILGSVLAGTGSSMFYPANNSAVMSNAEAHSYGSISGLLRLMGNLGTLGSFVMVITVASLAVPRAVAFEVFIGTSKIVGGISKDFMVGFHAVMITSIIILAIAGILSWTRGKENRGG